jgi:mRNA degradation ribonuclease J1/J2
MPKEFQHTLKAWEIAHSRLSLGDSIPKDQRFTMKIEDVVLVGRAVDKQGRIWIGTHVISKYQVGQVFKVIVDDSLNQVSLEPI